MKTIRILPILVLSTLTISCALTLKPVTTIKNSSVEKYKYIFVSPTISLTSSTGATYGSEYYFTSKSVNPRDVIIGILAKEGYILLPELKNELANETLIVNYGESGRRNIGLDGYTIEVTVQFVSSETRSLVCSCTAEGLGSTEADDIRIAITRCLSSLL